MCYNYYNSVTIVLSVTTVSPATSVVCVSGSELESGDHTGTRRVRAAERG